MGIESLLILVVYILVLALVIWAVSFLFARMGLPSEVRIIFMVVVTILFLLLILRQFGVV
jgi:hypothetical protein